MNEDSYMKSNPADLKDVLSPNVINLHLKGKTKSEIIEELLDILVKAEKIKDKKALKLYTEIYILKVISTYFQENSLGKII